MAINVEVLKMQDFFCEDEGKKVKKEHTDLLLLTEVNVKRSPLLWTGMEITTFYVQISGANCLRSKSIK